MDEELVFETSRYFERWKYVLKDDVIKVRRVDLLDSESFDLRYDEISNDPNEVTYSSKPRVFFAVCVWCWCGFGIVTQLLSERNWNWILLWLAASGLAFAIWYVSKRHYLVFRGVRRDLLIPVPKASDSGLQEFVDALLNVRREHLLSTYTQPGVPKGSLADEIQKLAWLRNTGALTDEEFESLKKTLISTEPSKSTNWPESVQ